MTPLEHVYFNAPINLHGCIVRDITRNRPFGRQDGAVSLGWELHLHAEWGCVVVTSHDDDMPMKALVPLVHVQSMVLHEVSELTVVPGEQGSRRGRPRTKRLGLAAPE